MCITYTPKALLYALKGHKKPAKLRLFFGLRKKNKKYFLARAAIVPRQGISTAQRSFPVRG